MSAKSANAEVAESLREILERIATAAIGAGRKPEDIALVAVSKVQPPDRVRAAWLAGHRVFGENRVQEAMERWAPLRGEFPDIRLHLIGPLQTNKVKDAVEFFDVIESIDRPKLARKIAVESDALGRRPVCLIQVNTGEEEQKAGVVPEEADALIALCRDELGLDLRGLMCIPPVEELPAPHFALLREIARRNTLPELSMGMSGDFEEGIRFGATMVRVGTAIFGSRRAP
ncbi:MAG: YggS family pyridoxal phosphate-dependent enzyme [Proteobacteria bacterium]|nr:YggS family pyridoxal phosphate-dependent enzyme [Pseudomonadota bacterium]